MSVAFQHLSTNQLTNVIVVIAATVNSTSVYPTLIRLLTDFITDEYLNRRTTTGYFQRSFLATTLNCLKYITWRARSIVAVELTEMQTTG